MLCPDYYVFHNRDCKDVQARFGGVVCPFSPKVTFVLICFFFMFTYVRFFYVHVRLFTYERMQ